MHKQQQIPKPLLERFRRKLYNTDHKVGENNIEKYGFDIHNPVFFITALLTIGFVVLTLLFPKEANAWLNGAKGWAVNTFDWFFISASNLFVLFCLLLVVSPYGSIRIGGMNAKPEFSRPSWFAMLFAAGMGIGLMFWSVSEPLAYASGWYGTPLNTAANTPEAFKAAMGATMYHWGLHPWAIYAVVGLSLALFAFNFNFPLTIRSVFYPIFKEKTWGLPGHLVDILAVVRGLEGGVKVLSNINMLIAIVLLAFIFFVSDPLALFGSLMETSVDYATYVLPLSNPVGREDDTFYHGWTVFYWAWWISWSPFVGMFIARISKGRTVREFLTSVMIIPTLVTLVWMTVFGQTGLKQYADKTGELAKGVTDASLTLFQMLEQLPFSLITSILAIILVLVFFITSSDSGSLVIDTITAGGKLEAPVPQRIFWAVTEGFIALALLYGGGKEALKTLQAGSVSTGLPFTFVLVIMCLSLFLGLRRIYSAREQLLNELDK